MLCLCENVKKRAFKVIIFIIGKINYTRIRILYFKFGTLELFHSEYTLNVRLRNFFKKIFWSKVTLSKAIDIPVLDFW